uniref:Uncharacterized protein n=1 Tax=Chenopodium quinoa TaxID=63459 RepID=A0A803N858_CHEQI
MGDYTSSGGDFEAFIENEAKRPHQWVNKLQKGYKLPKEKVKSVVSDHSSEALSVARSIEETRAQSANQLVDLKEQELENQLLCADVTKMGPSQRKLHEKELQVLAEKYGWTFDD